MANPAGIGALLEPGLRANYWEVWRPRYQGFLQQIGRVIWAEAPSDKIKEIYGYPLTAPYPRLWKNDENFPSDNFLSRRFQVINRDYAMRVYLPRNFEDDQTSSVFTVARDIGRNWGTLPERNFYAYIQGSIDIDLLPVIPQSADSNALYTSSVRYGRSAGNTVSQSGSTTVQQLTTDLYGAHQAFQEMQNTKNQPYHDLADLANISVFYGTTLNLLINQAQYLTRVPWEQTTGTNGTGQTPTNLLNEGGVRFTYVGSQRITDSKLYLFLPDLPVERRPLIRQVRKGQQEAQGNLATSDHTRNTGQPYIQFDSREGWGSAEAVSTIRIA